jgi:hypothetical protein
MRVLPVSQSYVGLILSRKVRPKMTKNVGGQANVSEVYQKCMVCGGDLPCYACTRELYRNRIKRRTVVEDISQEESDRILSLSPEIGRRAREVQEGAIDGVPWTEKERRMRAGVKLHNPIPGISTQLGDKMMRVG